MNERMETVVVSPATIHWPSEPGENFGSNHPEESLIEALRAGNEEAFEVLLDRLSPGMLGLARSIVADRELAEEVVQETWLAVIRGVERFEGRSAIKTWVFSILTNVARTRATRERRTIAFSCLSEAESPADKLAADAERFTEDRYAWMSPPPRRKETPESRILSKETVAVIRTALASMPPRQAEVVTLRDIEGWSAAEVCQALDLSEANQKVLLHRGRMKVRNVLTCYRNGDTPQGVVGRAAGL